MRVPSCTPVTVAACALLSLTTVTGCVAPILQVPDYAIFTKCVEGWVGRVSLLAVSASGQLVASVLLCTTTVTVPMAFIATVLPFEIFFIEDTTTPGWVASTLIVTGMFLVDMVLGFCVSELECDGQPLMTRHGFAAFAPPLHVTQSTGEGAALYRRGHKPPAVAVPCNVRLLLCGRIAVRMSGRGRSETQQARESTTFGKIDTDEGPHPLLVVLLCWRCVQEGDRYEIPFVILHH